MKAFIFGILTIFLLAGWQTAAACSCVGNGSPVAGAGVNIYDFARPNEQVFGFSDDVKTDAAGRFQITGFKGRKYLLHAFLSTDYLAGEGKQSERVEAVFDENAGLVKLVLDKNGVFIRQLK